jgi:RNA polymerase sigma-70 factor (ECF subfamily)
MRVRPPGEGAGPGEPAPQEGPADEALIARVAEGDRGALSALYQRHSGLLFSVALKILRSGGEAEDALHDTFLEAWQRAGDHQQARGTVRTWLLLRLRSRCLDRLRARERSREVDGAEALLEERPAEEQEAADLAPDRARVRQALQQLPEAQRTALDLAWFGGFTGQQIADQTGAPLGTVKTRLALGLARLRQLLDPPDLPGDGADEGPAGSPPRPKP